MKVLFCYTFQREAGTQTYGDVITDVDKLTSEVINEVRKDIRKEAGIVNGDVIFLSVTKLDL